jgi:aspartyl-tRNA(Asn)/glutamyl-tRNA(Gln) amidotransferase subunit A
VEITSLTVHETQALLRSKQVSPREVVEALVRRIETVDPMIHGYLSYDLDRALLEAQKADVRLPLGGVPISIKDVINVEGHPCSCASRILHGYIAPYDATVVAKLRAAGAIPFGRLNMDEFAMGSSTENSAFGPSRNPWDAGRIPGGSSGGSAAVVAADEAYAALGSDTGGSIRQPAALCGCVGLKPTYGRVSRFGLVAFASSLDQIGPLTKDVRDAALLMNVIAGPDPYDSTSLNEAVPDFAADLEKGVKGLKVGLP